MKRWLAALVFLATPAQAQYTITTLVACDKYQNLADKLTGEFAEYVLLQGQHVFGSQMEVWVNPDTGTWTIVVQKDGRACTLAEGNQINFGEPS